MVFGLQQSKHQDLGTIERTSLNICLLLLVVQYLDGLNLNLKDCQAQDLGKVREVIATKDGNAQIENRIEEITGR